MVEYSLEIYYSRFGVAIRPFAPKMGFDYNRVYISIEEALRDFRIHGWEVYGEPVPSKEPRAGSFYTFRKVER